MMFNSDITGRANTCSELNGPLMAVAPFVATGAGAVGVTGGLATALSIASTAAGVLGALQQGQAASAQADYQASVANRNAEISRVQTEQRLETQDRERRLRRGAAMAAGGASGVGVESFGDILSSSAVQEEMDLLNIKQQGLLQAQNFESEARFAKMQGKQAKTASYMSAGTKLLGGASNVFGKKTPDKTYYPRTGTTVTWKN